MELSLSKTFFHITIRLIVGSFALHEYAHVVAARLIGVYAVLKSTALNKVSMTLSIYSSLTPAEKAFWHGAGGYTAALIFVLFNRGNEDPDIRFANNFCAIESFIYGTFEAFAPRAGWDIGILLGLLVATSLFVGVILWKKPEIIL